MALALPLVMTALPPQVLPKTLSDTVIKATAQTAGNALQMRAARVEANSNTGVVTAIGNVQIDYPSRQIFATAAQAQYYSRDQRIVLSGNVDVEQEGNTLRAETVTYLVAEGRFVATPGANAQVEAVYLLPDESGPASSGEASTPAPISIPTPPDELPSELGPIDF
ncbi:LPS export ABC transporter periplasmic protein LptC [cf. Phormidesmis sp. LEGE 11477]|nr:LPS export ABC transporter periplasmic protein LptC [cf. Phormidesmis sp. LEGE 11477]